MIVLSAVAAHAQMTLPGKFEVTDTGSASYTIPISVVPGTAGLEPKLSLQYDSRGGNGLLGVGWSLAGLPAITRCGRTIAQDGAIGGINYDANDRFCLDGQRLIAVTGTYGADQTEYRTERESFSKVVSYGAAGAGPAWFKVWTKAGLVMEFGNTADSRIEAQGKTSVRVWAINKTSDTKGNWFSVSYIEDNANGEYRPARIDYTGNGTTAPANSVRFVYEERPDATPLYVGGARVKTTQRLVQIQAWKGEEKTREYRASYDISAASKRSRLISVLQCDAAGICLPGQGFTYRNGGGGLTTSYNAVSIGATGWRSTYAGFPADYNGDGVADIFLVGASSNYFCKGPEITQANACAPISTWGAYYEVYPGDYNGDGVTDMFTISSGVVHFCKGPEISQFNDCVPIGGNFGSGFGVYPGDYNGDGITDLFLVSDSWSYFCAGPGIATSNNCTGFPSGSWKTAFSFFPGDYNGDGITDLMFVDDTYTYFCPGPGITTGNNCGAYSSGGWKTSFTILPGDYNGDGVSDLFLMGNSWSYFCPGPGVTTANNCAGFETTYWKSAFSFYPGDYNGDGVTDMVFVDDGLTYFCAGPGITTANNCSAYASGGWKSYYSTAMGDFNGDGTADLMMMGDLGVYFLAGGDGQPDLLMTVTGDAGATTIVAYKPLTNAATYVKSSGAVYPSVDLQGPLQVVSEVKSSNGLGGAYRSTYRYAGAKADSHGRGFLGFRQMIVRDEQTGVEQVASYRQDYPFTGLVASREKKLGSQLLNRSTNAYGSTHLGGTRHYPFLTQSLEESWELSGTALPAVTTSYQYDAYGNATQVGVSTGDGHSKATTNTYSNDTTNWLLGRLTRSEVTSTTPGN